MIKIYKIIYLIILILLIIGCEKKPINENVEDYNLIFNTVKKYYPFIDFKNINLDSIYDVFLPQVENAESDELKDIYIDFLSKLKDGHANVYDNTGFPVYGYKIPRKEKDIESFDTTLIKKYINKEFKEFNEFRYDTIPNNIGYIHYKKFTGVKAEYEKFDLILEYLKETKGLIIDIRNNGGGNNASSYYMIKRLISTPFEGVQWTKKGGGLYPRETINPEGDYQYTKPIVVLINGVTFSSAEGFANLCKKISHIILIGDTTGGGSGVPEIFTLENSKIKLRIPVRCEMRYDGEHYEWNGIIPDILVSQTKEDIGNNQDKQLERAIEYLNNQ